MTDKLPETRSVETSQATLVPDIEVKVGDIFRRKAGVSVVRTEVIFINEEVILVKYLDKRGFAPFAFSHENFHNWYEKVAPKPRYFMNVYKTRDDGMYFGGAYTNPEHRNIQEGKKSPDYLKTIELTDLINEE